MSGDGDGPIRLPGPEISTKEAIGIVVAISGNVLISLALNLQKLAHRKLELGRAASASGTPSAPATGANTPARGAAVGADSDSDSSAGSPAAAHGEDEAAPLLPLGQARGGSYGSAPRRRGLTRLASLRVLFRAKSREQVTLPVDVAVPRANGARNGAVNTESGSWEEVIVTRQGHGRQSTASSVASDRKSIQGQEAEYLKSKLWWFGFLLMNIGEVGNFISYAFAPASTVAPLGTFALIANCVFAPVMLGERFLKIDILGILIAVIGAVTVVLSSNPSDTRLDPPALLHAIAQKPFIAYSIVYIVLAIILVGLSEKSPGNYGRGQTIGWVCVDVGLCALFGGFTVLSTKGVSTLLTIEGSEMFTEWITYPMLVVLLGTGVGQIKYLNRALMRFDSKVVIPAQFVFFNLSAIVGSAILYGDFRRATFHQIVTFLYGCAATFAGVFIIASASGGDGGDDEDADTEDNATPASPLVHTQGGLGLEPGVDVGRRNRATLVIPNGHPALRGKASTVGIVGLSTQRVLLEHTPPREALALRDVEMGSSPSSPLRGSRRRAISWFGEAPARGGPGARHDEDEDD